MFWRVDYSKLANELYYKCRSDIANAVADKIASIFASNEEFLKKLSENIYVKRNVYDRNGYLQDEIVRIEALVGERVAERLVEDVYALNKAEILKEVSSQGILSLLENKLHEQAKQHVLDFVTKGK